MTKADFKRRKDEGISRVEAVTEKIKMATSGKVEINLEHSLIFISWNSGVYLGLNKSLWTDVDENQICW